MFSQFLFLSACNTFFSVSYCAPSLPCSPPLSPVTLFSPFGRSASVVLSFVFLVSDRPLADLTSHQKCCATPHQVHNKQRTRLSENALPAPESSPVLAECRWVAAEPPPPPVRTGVACPDPHSVSAVTPDYRSLRLHVSGIHWGGGLINQDNVGEVERSCFLFPAGKPLSSSGCRPLHRLTSSWDRRNTAKKRK